MFEELKDYIASHTKEEIQEDWKETPEFESEMTVEEWLNNYAEAENELLTAIEAIRKNKEILMKDFEKKNPGYYIKDVRTYPKPNITIYSKKDNKLIKPCVFLNSTGKYNL